MLCSFLNLYQIFPESIHMSTLTWIKSIVKLIIVFFTLGHLNPAQIFCIKRSSETWNKYLILILKRKDQCAFLLLTGSAAGKVDTKLSNLLLKEAQKVATLKNQFKTGFPEV